MEMSASTLRERLKDAKEVGPKTTRPGASAGPTCKAMLSHFVNCRSGFTPRSSMSGSNGKNNRGVNPLLH